ncbi:MAG: hypothetical protein ACUZ8A_06805, partial [Candidatus Bathyanammoxibius sp.]
EMGHRVGLMRPVTLWPFPKEALQRLSRKAKAFLVIEMSAGQMVEDVKLSILGRRPVFFYGRTGGGVPSTKDIINKILEVLPKIVKTGPVKMTETQNVETQNVET